MKFWRTEKFSVNQERILKKCKCKKNLENFRNIGKFLEIFEKGFFLTNMKKFLKKFDRKIGPETVKTRLIWQMLDQRWEQPDQGRQKPNL